MSGSKLDRRRATSGSMALAASCMLWGRAGAMQSAATDAADFATSGLVADEQMFLAEEEARHAPFRAEFLKWLGETSDRFASPVSAQAKSPSSTVLSLPGLHPALEIRLSGDCWINVDVTWEGVFWDILASMDVPAEQARDGAGWRNKLFIPEAQCLRPTREACWRQDGFEWLLHWLNNNYMSATHLALYGERGWTAANLAREGMLLGGKFSVQEMGPVRYLLPLHTGS